MIEQQSQRQSKAWWKKAIGAPRWWLINVPAMILFLALMIWIFERV